jgi:hypothetical protein
MVIGGAALLLLAAGGGYMALRPGRGTAPSASPPSSAPPSPAPATAKPADPPPPPRPAVSPEEAEWADAKTEAARGALVLRRIDAARGSDEASSALHDFLRGKNRSDLAAKAVEARLAADPSSPWANAALGRTDARPIFEELAASRDLDRDAPPEWERLRARLKEGRTWIAPGQERNSLDADVAAVREHLRVLADPWQREMLRVVAETRAEPAFKDFGPVDHRALPPYVVMAQHQSDPRRHATKNVLDNHAKFFQCLTKEFLRVMGEAGLPTPTVAEMGNPVLKAFVFYDRNAFDRWHWNLGVKDDFLRGIRAYYSGDAQVMMLYDTGAHAELQDEDTCTAFHEATHQLVHYYRRYYLTQALRAKDPAAPDVAFLDRRLWDDSHWFQEGFAEFFGAADRISTTTGEWRLLRPHRQRLGEWGNPRLRRQPQWTLDEVLRMRDSTGLHQLAEKKWPGHRDELSSLYYAQAWALNHFLYFGRDGAYRARYLKVVAEEMRCHSGYEVFLEGMGAGDGEARKAFLKTLEQEWLDYVCELLQR